MTDFDAGAGGLGLGQAFIVMVTAAMASAFVVGLIRRRAGALGLVDVPNVRSSHKVPTPRGGGLGILAGLSFAVVVVHLMAPAALSRNAVSLVGCSLVVGMVGLIDDRTGLSAKLRLGLHVGSAAILVVSTGPLPTLPLPPPFDVAFGSVWVSVPLTVLWVVAATNFFNFMDGVDALAGGQAIASCAGAILAGFSADATGVAAALGGASAGFLLYNWPPASIFMGDVGSGSIGFLLGGLPLLAPSQERPAALLAVAIGLTFFILDPFLTLLRRALRGEALMRSHREHLYQMLIPAGTSGQRVTGTLVAGAALLSVLGAFGYQRTELGWIAVCTSMALFSIEVVCVWRWGRGNG
ncbi:MAG: glycosyl transferase [Dehalococcoidia bacterium]|nr:glycosyl transferase [Dehalococcoidia bacterium]